MVKTVTFFGWWLGISASLYALNGPLKRRWLQRKHDAWLEQVRREHAEKQAAAQADDKST